MSMGKRRTDERYPVGWKIAVVAIIAAIALVAVIFAQRAASTPPVTGQTRPIPTFGTPAPTYSQFGNAPMPTDRPARVLYMGTSVTIGYYATTTARKWTSLVSAELSKYGAVNEIPPIRTPQPAGAPTMLATYDPAAIPTGMDLIVLELTTNDVKRTPIAVYSPAYARLLDTIQSGSPTAKVVCLGAWQTQPGDWDISVRQMCANRGASFVSLSDIMKAEGARGPGGRATEYGTSDEFHPNDKGEQLIAEAVLDKLSAFVGN